MSENVVLGGRIFDELDPPAPVEGVDVTVTYDAASGELVVTPIEALGDHYQLRIGPPNPRGIPVSNTEVTRRLFTPETHAVLWRDQLGVPSWSLPVGVAVVVDGTRGPWLEIDVPIETGGFLVLERGVHWDVEEITDEGLPEGKVRFTTDASASTLPGLTMRAFATTTPYEDIEDIANINAASVAIFPGTTTDIGTGGVQGQTVYASIVVQGPAVDTFRLAADEIASLVLAGVVVPSAPTIVTPPSYDSGVTAGVARFGTAVVVDPGVYADAGEDEVTFEWYRDGALIEGEDTDTYVPDEDTDDTLDVWAKVIATNEAGSVSTVLDPFQVLYEAPSVVTPVDDIVEPVSVAGFVEVDLAGRVSGDNLSYEITAGGGTLDFSGGGAVWRHPVTSVQALTAQQIEVENSGGIVHLDFDLTITQAGGNPVLAGSAQPSAASPIVMPARTNPSNFWTVAFAVASATTPAAINMAAPLTRHTSLLQSSGMSAAGDTDGEVASYASQNIGYSGSRNVGLTFGLDPGEGSISRIGAFATQPGGDAITTNSAVGDYLICLDGHNGPSLVTPPTGFTAIAGGATSEASVNVSARASYKIATSINEVVPAGGGGRGRHVLVYRFTPEITPDLEWPTVSDVATITMVTDPTEAQDNGFGGRSGHLKIVTDAGVDPTQSTASGDAELVLSPFGRPPATAALLAVTPGATTYTARSATLDEGFSIGQQVQPEYWWRGTSGSLSGLFERAWQHPLITVEALTGTSAAFPTMRASAINEAAGRPLLRHHPTLYSGTMSSSPAGGMWFVSLALDVFAKGQTSGSNWQKLVDQMKYTVASNARNDPLMEAGYPMQHYLDTFTGAAVCRRIPSVWAALTQAEKDRWDSLWLAAAVSSAYSNADAHPAGDGSRYNLNGLKTFTRRFAPNFKNAPIAFLLMAATWWGTPGNLASGVTQVTNRLNAFNMANFATTLQSQGLLNCYDVFKRPLNANAPTAAVVQACCLNWRWGQPLSNTANWINFLQTNTLSHTVKRGLDNGAGQLCADGVMRGRLPAASGNSPVHGQVGEFFELDMNDGGGTKTGTGGPVAAGTVLPKGRSSTHYASAAPRILMNLMAAMLVTGTWNKAGATEGLIRTRMTVGWRDFFYKIETYLSRANGGPKSTGQGLTISGISHTGSGSPARDPDGKAEFNTTFRSYTEFLWTDVLQVASAP